METNTETTNTVDNTENSVVAPPAETTAPVADKKARKASGKTTKKASKAAAAAAAASAVATRNVTATLEQRQVRVIFRKGGKTVATSATYKSRNTADKLIAFAKRQLGAAKIGDAKPVLQQLDAKDKWVNVEA